MITENDCLTEDDWKDEWMISEEVTEDDYMIDVIPQPGMDAAPPCDDV